jgi:hypothetical protein
MLRRHHLWWAYVALSQTGTIRHCGLAVRLADGSGSDSTIFERMRWPFHSPTLVDLEEGVCTGVTHSYVYNVRQLWEVKVESGEKTNTIVGKDKKAF